ncbi:MAG: hypothetical protein WA063_05080 [Minisyncoccia bacterium]
MTSQTAFQTGSNSITISSLNCATTYYYCVAAEDAGNNVWYSGITSQSTASCGGGGGSGYVDSTAPAISNISVTAGTTTATIIWTTNESSISWVAYGTSTSYGLEASTTAYNTSHSLTLVNLLTSTTYHYQIKSKDSAGNIGSYADKTLTTLALGEKPKVEEIKKPISEMTTAELRAEISRIAALISQLQSQLAKAKIVGIPTGCLFKKNLSSGVSNKDVVCLKTILANEGCLKGTKNTNYFGTKTLAGVKCLCQKYKEDISKAVGSEVKCSGFVGKGMRAKLNQIISK